MGTSYFHHAAVDRAVQACEAAGVEFIALAPRPRTAFAFDLARPTYVQVTWTGGDTVQVQVRALPGPISDCTEAGPVVRAVQVTFTGRRRAGHADAEMGAAGPADDTASAATPEELGDTNGGAPTARAAAPTARAAVRELREGHDDAVWPIDAGDTGSVDAMLATRRPGGVVAAHVREVVDALTGHGVVAYGDSVYVVESDQVRRTGRRVAPGPQAMVAGPCGAALVDLHDLAAVAALLGVNRWSAGVREFAAQLSVNGAASYSGAGHLWAGAAESYLAVAAGQLTSQAC